MHNKMYDVQVDLVFHGENTAITLIITVLGEGGQARSTSKTDQKLIFLIFFNYHKFGLLMLFLALGVNAIKTYDKHLFHGWVIV